MHSAPVLSETIPEGSGLEAAVDELIEQFDGDPRAAIRVLVVANGFLEQRLERLKASVSKGYVRGRFDELLQAVSLASGHSGER